MISDRIQFIGHSSLLIELDGQNFLVDPVFSPKIAGFAKRVQPAGVDPSTLPAINAILVTSGQADHLDIFSYKYFKQDIPLVTPPDLENFYHRFLHNPVMELAPWTEEDIGAIKVAALPSRYFCWRFFGLKSTGGLSYLLQGSRHSVFISGDSAYGRHFAEIGNAFAIDVACLPIGGYHPRWLMGGRHMNPAQALKAFGDLGAKVMIPIHYGAFQISFEPMDEPEQKLRQALHEGNIQRFPSPSMGDGDQVHILKPGESFTLDKLALLSPPGIPSPLATIHTLKTPA